MLRRTSGRGIRGWGSGGGRRCRGGGIRWPERGGSWLELCGSSCPVWSGGRTVAPLLNLQEYMAVCSLFLCVRVRVCLRERERER